MWIHLLSTGLVDGASGQPVPPQTATKSGVSRLWLIDYYTKEWAKRDAPAADVEAVATPITPALKRKATIARKRKVAELVDKAEADIAKLTQGVESAIAAQQFTLQLLAYAQQLPESEIDFMSIAHGYRKKQAQEDDELLLLAMVI
jgi:hypothetical protein